MFTGTLVALVTPFDDGEVDFETLRELVNFQIQSGVDGIVPVGTTGESPTLTHQEHKQVIQVVVEEAAGHLGFDLVWEGRGLEERGIDRKTGKTVIRIDPHYFRPAEVDLLIGDASKAKEKLGWEPRIKFRDLIRTMTEKDFAAESKVHQVQL